MWGHAQITYTHETKEEAITLSSSRVHRPFQPPKYIPSQRPVSPARLAEGIKRPRLGGCARRQRERERKRERRGRERKIRLEISSGAHCWPFVSRSQGTRDIAKQCPSLEQRRGRDLAKGWGERRKKADIGGGTHGWTVDWGGGGISRGIYRWHDANERKNAGEL